MIKFFIWSPWFLAIIILLSTNGIKKIDPLAATTNGLSVTDLHGYLILYLILGLIITLALTAGKRSFCPTFAGWRHLSYWGIKPAGY